MNLAKMAEMAAREEFNCQVCSRELENPEDPLSRDLGGDCQMCMAEAGDHFALQHLWVFSFGGDHAHSLTFDGERMTFDMDGCLGIVGDCDATRAKIFELIGPKWSMQYRIDNWNPKFFPRGIIKWIRA